MAVDDRNQATRILRRMAGAGHDDEAAAARLLPVVYEELRRLAAGYLNRERVDHTLQPTALVHEAFIRLIDQEGVTYNDRTHFLAIAARAMRQVLVDSARRRRAGKRGGSWNRLSLSPVESPDDRLDVDLLALHDSLQRLDGTDGRLSRVVELRFFGGLTIKETAAALDVSHTTVENDWALARAWLARDMSREDSPS